MPVQLARFVRIAPRPPLRISKGRQSESSRTTAPILKVDAHTRRASRGSLPLSAGLIDIIMPGYRHALIADAPASKVFAALDFGNLAKIMNMPVKGDTAAVGAF